MPRETCEKCGGNGWVLTEREGLSGVERCGCAQAERIEGLLENAGIPDLYRKASFDNFALPHDNPTAHRQLAAVMLAVRTYTREFPATDKPGLMLLGDPGSGKTHLAVAALRVLISRGFEGVFWDYSNLLDSIRSGYDRASGSIDREAYRSALDTEILLLDDLGAHRITDWVEDTVTSLITYRCNHRKPLIATTNLPDPDAGSVIVERSGSLPGQVQYKVTLAEKIGTRARSRLFEMCKLVRMPLVEDYRLRKQR